MAGICGRSIMQTCVSENTQTSVSTSIKTVQYNTSTKVTWSTLVTKSCPLADYRVQYTTETTNTETQTHDIYNRLSIKREVKELGLEMMLESGDVCNVPNVCVQTVPKQNKSITCHSVNHLSLSHHVNHLS